MVKSSIGGDFSGEKGEQTIDFNSLSIGDKVRIRYRCEGVDICAAVGEISEKKRSLYNKGSFLQLKGWGDKLFYEKDIVEIFAQN